MTNTLCYTLMMSSMLSAVEMSSLFWVQIWSWDIWLKHQVETSGWLFYDRIFLYSIVEKFLFSITDFLEVLFLVIGLKTKLFIIHHWFLPIPKSFFPLSYHWFVHQTSSILQVHLALELLVLRLLMTDLVPCCTAHIDGYRPEVT